MTEGYALVLLCGSIGYIGYERLFSEHKIRPPPWVRAWVETQVTLDNVMKEELKVWRMVQARLAEDQAQLEGNVIDHIIGQDNNDKLTFFS